MSMYKDPWFIVLAIAVIIFVIALIGYAFVFNQGDVPTWIWVMVALSFVLVVCSFALYGVQSKGMISSCGQTVIVKQAKPCTTTYVPPCEDTLYPN